MSLNSTAGDAAAESYFAIADADAYFLARGVTAWGAAVTGDKEAAARKAATYLDNQYRGRWVGLASSQVQALAWPRADGTRTLVRSWIYPLLDENGFQVPIAAIPVQVKTAAMEAALLALGGATLEPTLVRGGQIKSLQQGVGPLSETTVWQDGAPVVDRYLVIEGLLRALVTSTPGSSSGNVKLVRS